MAAERIWVRRAETVAGKAAVFIPGVYDDKSGFTIPFKDS